jgi:hypothetical protein
MREKLEEVEGEVGKEKDKIEGLKMETEQESLREVYD